MAGHVWVLDDGEASEWTCSRCQAGKFIASRWAPGGRRLNSGVVEYDWPVYNVGWLNNDWLDDKQPDCLGDRIEALSEGQGATMRTLWEDGYSWPNALTAAELLP